MAPPQELESVQSNGYRNGMRKAKVSNNGHAATTNGTKNGVKANSTKVTQPLPKITPSVLHNIGKTPLIRLNRIPQSFGIECEVLAKCELFGPGGSHKDRIALRMIEDAEADGRLKPGYTVIEPTSGNTGIAVAMVCAVKGYRCILVMPEKMSAEKHWTMTNLGATVVRCPNNVVHTTVADKIHKETPNSIILDQYGNEANPRVHYEETTEEILDQCDGDIDMIVIGVGTGGAITGIGRKIKEKCPNCPVIGVDPVGSTMALPDSLNSGPGFFEVEGIGHTWLPDCLDRSVVDKWIKVEDKDTFNMARRIISEEGLLVGGSCGSALIGAMRAIKEAGLGKGKRCVIIFPDSVRNYMTKFLSDQWMLERGFMPDSEISQNYSWWGKPVSQLKLEAPLTVLSDSTVGNAIKLMKGSGRGQVAVISNSGAIEGVLSLDHLLKQLISVTVSSSTPVKTVLSSQFKRITPSDTLGKLTYILQGTPFALVVKTEIVSGNMTEKLVGIASQMDLATLLA